MGETQRLRRFCAVAFAALTIVCGGAFAADSKGAAPTSKETALPQPLTRESIRELVARMSDDEVRKLLLEQLDRAAAAAPATAAKGEMGMAGTVEEHAGAMRNVYDDLKAAAIALPTTLRGIGTRLMEPDGLPRLGLIVGLIIASLGAGWIAEKIYDRAILAYRTRLRQSPSETFTANVARRGIGLSLDFAGLVLFATAAISIFFLLWHDDRLQRIAIFSVLLIVILFRCIVLVLRFLLAPAAPSQRLLPLADAPARILYRFVLAFAATYLAEMALINLLHAVEATSAMTDFVWLAVLPVYIVLVNVTVWRVRLPIAALIRGDGKRGVLVNWAADLWAVIATLYFLGIAAARVFAVLAGESTESGVGLLSVLLVIALPVVDMALCRALSAATNATPKDSAAPLHSIVTDYEPVFRRAIHIIVAVVGLLMFARLWDLDVFALAQRSMGGKISGSLLGIAIVLLLAYMIWEAVKTAIDRRLRAEGDIDEEHPQSRLRTVLPIIRGTVLVTVVVMAIMSILAALGVDILPLLAGASVVGVAIGFGSQTLVRDIVCGAFFLMDDAFRLGEYIEVGDAKGRVEKINIRSVFLRHHRGAINILPYGEIKRLRNTSRDWVVHVLDFRLTYDTNLAKVKKILKDVGAEISADEELAPDLLQPLKLGGVLSAEDSAIIVRAKFTARPEGEPWMIRKAAYTKILKAFRDNGIKFAHREVTVNVPAEQLDGETMRAVAGAASGAAVLDAQSGNVSR